jgi:hypothetical protein
MPRTHGVPANIIAGLDQVSRRLLLRARDRDLSIDLVHGKDLATPDEPVDTVPNAN